MKEERGIAGKNHDAISPPQMKPPPSVNPQRRESSPPFSHHSKRRRGGYPEPPPVPRPVMLRPAPGGSPWIELIPIFVLFVTPVSLALLFIELPPFEPHVGSPHGQTHRRCRNRTHSRPANPRSLNPQPLQERAHRLQERLRNLEEILAHQTKEGTYEKSSRNRLHWRRPRRCHLAFRFGLKVLTGLLGLVAGIAASILHFLLSKSVLTLAVLGFYRLSCFNKETRIRPCSPLTSTQPVSFASCHARTKVLG